MILLLIVVGPLLNDFELGVNEYQRGHYQTARAFFEAYRRETPDAGQVPEALYYLTRIAGHEGDFNRFWNLATSYLDIHRYAARREEVFNLLLQRLIEREAYWLAFSYIARYEYLAPDPLYLHRISLALAESVPTADSIWQVLPQDDSIRIIRAAHINSPEPRDAIFRLIPGFSGKLLRLENHLNAGDTLAAYFLYLETGRDSVPGALVYRFAKIARLFDRPRFEMMLAALRAAAGYENKTRLLERLEFGIDRDRVYPADAEETGIMNRIFNRDSVRRPLPETLDLPRRLAENPDTVAVLAAARAEFPGTYRLDSMWCRRLLDQGRLADAWAVIQPYARFWNTERFTRSVRARVRYQERRYEACLLDIVLSQDHYPPAKYLYAECLSALGHEAGPSYAEAAAAATDSALRFNAYKQYVENRYSRRDWPAIAALNAAVLNNDTTLLRRYATALVRTGQKIRADSVWRSVDSLFGIDYQDHYGEFLIEHRSFDQAAALYDSLAAGPAGLPDQVWFNRALVSFQAGVYDTALVRFRRFVRSYPSSSRYCPALFKLATIFHMAGDFDSAGFYYGRAARDTALQHDALQNQIISFKKAETWGEEIKAAQRFLPVALEAERPETYFELGYAYLRLGNYRRCIEYLERAVRAGAKPEFHYWLAEAYLGRGDFIRALYHYQVIVAKFPKDEMWGPTAEFKCGLALEFLDALEEARTLYAGIIKRRGAADVWGSEAAKRLELLK